MIAIIFIIITALTIPGIINKTRAIIAGRYGPRFLQPLLNTVVLLRKGSTYSTTSTIITELAAPVYLAALITAALCIPIGSFGAVISFDGDVILFCYLLALSRIAMLLAAADSGSALQGMGAARDMKYAMLGEPALFLLIATLALITGNYSFSAIFLAFDNHTANLIVLSMVVGFGIFKISLAECSRVPIDDPKTHLELTMIHEVMILDLSGIDLAMVHIGAWIKLSVFATLFANTLVPAGLSNFAMICSFIAVITLYGIAIGTIESLMARNRISKNNIFMLKISAIGLLAFTLAMLIYSNIIPS